MKPLRYVRFVVAERSPQTGHRLGLFNGIDNVRGHFSAEQDARYQSIYDWFAKNLPAPTRFTRSKYPRAADVALSWFKDDAEEFISGMREIAAILASHGVDTEMLKTERPGYIVYEDEHQVVATPFADTPT
ncbi:MAG: hypothetical protein J0I48_11530 [Devosia sp.]|uniref:hypothetical protein n=1 Tax=Devosia sp. 66-22 TaxID=1895753 RepID=UPI000926A1F8|nr:hypothetical protein [Devosia sp. 66-22]MBN9346814.1 hypothetical protein [Devosia sp.]MCC6779744.1 hypothetical protein [Hyphomicrobiales bacterium]OJX53848.1 MAG: hypothetical protein BGO81_15000 [Devosia sp. 66-22]